MTQLPTFLGIGSARSGSTWLHRALDLHPQIRMTQPKQLEFFVKTMFMHDLRWYLDHFRTPEGEETAPVRGEITPFYCRLPARFVRHIRKLFPDLRIVLTIRNPIDRIWSNAGLDFHRYGGLDLETIGIGRFERFACRKRTRLYTDYERIIRDWTSVFGEDAVHVEVFDDIQANPAALLRRVFAHLGADPDWEPPAELIERRVLPEGSKRQEVRAPDELRWFIAQAWLPKVRSLDRMLEGRVAHWVRELESTARTGTLRWRVRGALNRTLLSLPERVAFAGYERLRHRKSERRWQVLFREAAELTGAGATH